MENNELEISEEEVCEVIGKHLREFLKQGLTELHQRVQASDRMNLMDYQHNTSYKSILRKK